MNTALTEREAALIGPRELKEPGSRPWALQMVQVAKLRYLRANLTVKEWQSTLDELKQYKAWQVLGYPDEDAMLKTEIGHSRADTFRSVQARANQFNEKDMAKHGGYRERKGQPRVTRLTEGETADYLTARIARDHPKIHQRMKDGEFKSVRAAAIEAGLVKVLIRIPIDPARAARLIRKHFTSEQIAELICALEAT